MIPKKGIVMKKNLILTVCLLMFATFGNAIAGSNSSGFGLGIMLGEPSGISGKLWSGEKNAFDFGLAWSTGKNSGAAMHADYIWHKMDMINVDEGALPFYYGIGVRYRSRDNSDDNIGVRVPLGLDYLFAQSAFDVFFEIVPILDLSPDTDFDINVAIGGRYFF
jgi:hypothetical protein